MTNYHCIRPFMTSQAPITTSKEQRMKVSYMKGIATYHGSESYLDLNQWEREALHLKTQAL